MPTRPISMTKQVSDAQWYFDRAKDPDNMEFYKVFSVALRRYNVQWCDATPQERYFIEEVVRVELERKRAQRLGLPLSEISPAFAYTPAL